MTTENPRNEWSTTMTKSWLHVLIRNVHGNFTMIHAKPRKNYRSRCIKIFQASDKVYGYFAFCVKESSKVCLHQMKHMQVSFWLNHGKFARKHECSWVWCIQLGSLFFKVTPTLNVLMKCNLEVNNRRMIESWWFCFQKYWSGRWRIKFFAIPPNNFRATIVYLVF